jgi:hypothetical protein
MRKQALGFISYFNTLTLALSLRGRGNEEKAVWSRDK